MENNENLNNQMKENKVQEEKKNNTKVIGIVLIVIGLILIGFAGYKLFIEKPEPDKPKNDNTQEQENHQKTDDSNLDLSQIIAKSFEVREFEPNKLELIQDTKTFKLVGENDASLYVNVNGSKANISYKSKENNINKEFNNVSKVFYSDYGNCSPHVLVYVISDSAVYIVNIDNYSDIYEETLTENNFVKKISNANKYVDIYMDRLHPSTCDFIPLWLGRTADGKYYDLDTSTEYLENTYFYYDDGNNYIKNDKTYKLGGYTGKIKLAIIYSEDEALFNFIDENNNLYKLNDDWNGYSLVSNEKVTSIKQQNKRLIINFANGTNKEIELELMDIYK